MNNKYIQYNLEEAEEEIQIMLKQLRAKKEYSSEEFYSSMQHLYHHLNIAWNSRLTSWDEVEKSTSTDIENWGKFPTDITLLKE